MSTTSAQSIFDKEIAEHEGRKRRKIAASFNPEETLPVELENEVIDFVGDNLPTATDCAQVFTQRVNTVHAKDLVRLKEFLDERIAHVSRECLKLSQTAEATSCLLLVPVYRGPFCSAKDLQTAAGDFGRENREAVEKLFMQYVKKSFDERRFQLWFVSKARPLREPPHPFDFGFVEVHWRTKQCQELQTNKITDKAVGDFFGLPEDWATTEQ